MPATREQLIARWETEGGLQLAEDLYQALNPLRGPARVAATLTEISVGILARFPWLEQH
jgi:hypothetical protein